MGTLHVLEAARTVGTAKAIVNVILRISATKTKNGNGVIARMSRLEAMTPTVIVKAARS